MNANVIVESGMSFGPYPEGHCFRIEQSACYRNLGEGVQMAEFLLFKQQKAGPTIWVIEAKSSSPQPKTQPKFAEYIEEIRSKLSNAFLLMLAARLERHSAAGELPEAFSSCDLRTLSFRFVLVINGHPQAWLPPLQSALQQALKPVVKAWALPATAVVVLNHESARQHGLIMS